MPVLPLDKGSQLDRPRQPVLQLERREIDRCVNDVLRPWLQRLGATPLQPALVTYMTDIPVHAWPLGLSSSLHRLPLVVIGKGMRWALEVGGARGASVPARTRHAPYRERVCRARAQAKLPAVTRGLQLLQAAAPRQPVVFADGTDTVIAHAPNRPVHLELLTRAAMSSRLVLFSAECQSWPRCYKRNYTAHVGHRTCRATGSRTCFPNSGAYLASSKALLKLLPALVHATADGFGARAESGDDQAAVHHANLGHVAQSLEVTIDQTSAFFLSLGACKGDGRPRTFLDDFELCHYGGYNPLERLGRRAGAAPHMSDAVAGAQHPVLMHANGLHERMHKAWFGSPERNFSDFSRRRARNLTALWWEALVPDAAAQLAHPVLLVDSAEGGLCRVVPLRDVVTRGAKDS